MGLLPPNTNIFGKGLNAVKLPKLPSFSLITKEAENIDKAQPTSRYYIDMLLDVFPNGYHHAAIWNVLQRQDQTEELKKLTKLQHIADKNNHDKVCGYFFNKLDFAFEQNTPYSEIISTQVMALPALCNAVKKYNKKRKTNLKIHQYLTDLPTLGAVHFFDTLSKLDEKQRQLICVYGVDLEKNHSVVNNKLKMDEQPFHKLINIDPANNPMVRQGFKDDELKKISNSEDITIKYEIAQQADGEITIKANEKIAYIMLGSQASDDTYGYVEKIIQLKQYNKIFVFGGNNPILKDQVSALKSESCEIILLDNQDDKHSAPIRVRSDLAIIRGGGLSIMEEMAMPHNNPDQIVLLHSKRAKNGLFSSGISWEDDNGTELIKTLKGKIKKIARTRVEEIIPEIMTRFPDQEPIQVFGDSAEAKLIYALENQINAIRAKENYADFVTALDLLLADIKNNIKFNKKGEPTKSGLKLGAKLATQTIDLINALDKNPEDLNAIKTYQKKCHRLVNYPFVAKVVALVAMTALGIFIGGLIGSVIGFLAGILTGPGAIVTAISGLFYGIYSGAGVGLVVGATIAGLGMTYFTAPVLFKPNKLTIDTRNVAQQATRVKTLG